MSRHNSGSGNWAWVGNMMKLNPLSFMNRDDHPLPRHGSDTDPVPEKPQWSMSLLLHHITFF